MIDKGLRRPSIARQCSLLGLSRSGVYRRPKAVPAGDLALMRLLDEQYLETPFYGSRKMAAHLRRLGHAVGRKRVRRLMRKLGLEAIYRRPHRARHQQCLCGAHPRIVARSSFGCCSGDTAEFDNASMASATRKHGRPHFFRAVTPARLVQIVTSPPTSSRPATIAEQSCPP